MDEHDRHGVKIAHCPAWGGVWLGKGERDHLIAAVRPPVTLAGPEPARPAAPAPQLPRFGRQDPPKAPKHDPPKAPKPVRFEDHAPARAKKPGKSHRHTGRYSRSAQIRDVLEEIFDFD